MSALNAVAATFPEPVAPLTPLIPATTGTPRRSLPTKDRPDLPLEGSGSASPRTGARRT